MEIAPNSVYLSEHLENVTEHFYKALRDSGNQKQMVASGWIATPETMSLNEAHAARVFEAASMPGKTCGSVCIGIEASPKTET